MGSSSLKMVASLTTALYACNNNMSGVSHGALLRREAQRRTGTLSLAVRNLGSSWKASLTSRLKRLNRVSSCSTYFSES